MVFEDFKSSVSLRKRLITNRSPSRGMSNSYKEGVFSFGTALLLSNFESREHRNISGMLLCGEEEVNET